MPAGGRDLLRARLDAVSETGRQVLAAAAVLGRSFDVDTVRAVSGRTDEETVAALEELVRRGLIREGAPTTTSSTTGCEGSYPTRPASPAAGCCTRGRRAPSAARPQSSPATSNSPGRTRRPPRPTLRAADQARGVRQRRGPRTPPRRARARAPTASALHAAIGDLETLAGDYAAARAATRAAADATPADLPGIEHRLGRLRHRRGEWALARGHFRAALEACPTTSRPRAPASRPTSASPRTTPATRPGAELARQASRSPAGRRPTGPRPGAQHARHARDAGGGIDDAFEHLGPACDLAEQIGDLPGRVAALNNLALAPSRARRTRAARSSSPAPRSRCAPGRATATARPRCTTTSPTCIHAAGHPDETMAHLKSAVAIFAEVGAEASPPEIWKLARW